MKTDQVELNLTNNQDQSIICFGLLWWMDQYETYQYKEYFNRDDLCPTIRMLC